ncbi:MAG: hypothetical protein WBP94_01265 [Rhodomicrobiaceae bacterium]
MTMRSLESRPVQTLIALAAFAALLAGAAGLARWLQFAYAPATAAEYLAYVGGEVKAVPAGQLEYDGRRFACGRFPTVFNPKLDDYGAAYFGFILINPKRFELLPPTIKRYAYGHECGHQHVGYDEGEADCYSIRRGQAEGWLDKAAMDEICAFISDSKGDAIHPLGIHRCQMMRRCFARARPGREPL